MMLDDLSQELSNLYGDLERFLIPKLTDEQKKEKSSRGEYEYIGYGLRYFVRDLSAGRLQWVNDHRDEIDKWWNKYDGSNPITPTCGLSFIDVGCGIGTKLFVAKNILSGFREKITGIEITPEYIEIARRLVPEAHIIQDDALKIDYSTYDIIYFYRLLIDAKKEMELETRIIKTAKSGACILPASHALFTSSKELMAMVKYMGWGYQKR